MTAAYVRFCGVILVSLRPKITVGWLTQKCTHTLRGFYDTLQKKLKIC